MKAVRFLLIAEYRLIVRTAWYFHPPCSYHVIYALTYVTRAGIAQSVQRLATDWTTKTSEFESQLGQDFLLLHVVQTDSGSHSAPYPMGTGDPFPGGKAAGA
jgi:hypothetical protein